MGRLFGVSGEDRPRGTVLQITSNDRGGAMLRRVLLPVAVILLSLVGCASDNSAADARGKTTTPAASPADDPERVIHEGLFVRDVRAAWAKVDSLAQVLAADLNPKCAYVAAGGGDKAACVAERLAEARQTNPPGSRGVSDEVLIAVGKKVCAAIEDGTRDAETEAAVLDPGGRGAQVIVAAARANLCP